MKPAPLKSSILTAFILLACCALSVRASGPSSAVPIPDGSKAQHHSGTNIPFRPADDIIYDNGAPGRSGAAFEMSGFIEADDFAVSSDAMLTTVFFWDLEDPNGLGYQGEIDWVIYADAGATPGATLASGTANGSQVTRTFIRGGISGIYDQYSNSVIISPGVPLTAGTVYWLGLHNGPLTFTTWADFFWQVTAGNGTFTSHYDEAPFFDNYWGDDASQQAFYLSGTTSALFVERTFRGRTAGTLVCPATGVASKIAAAVRIKTMSYTSVLTALSPQ